MWLLPSILSKENSWEIKTSFNILACNDFFTCFREFEDLLISYLQSHHSAHSSSLKSWSCTARHVLDSFVKFMIWNLLIMSLRSSLSRFTSIIKVLKVNPPAKQQKIQLFYVCVRGDISTHTEFLSLIQWKRKKKKGEENQSNWFYLKNAEWNCDSRRFQENIPNIIPWKVSNLINSVLIDNRWTEYKSYLWWFKRLILNRMYCSGNGHSLGQKTSSDVITSCTAKLFKPKV